MKKSGSQSCNGTVQSLRSFLPKQEFNTRSVTFGTAKPRKFTFLKMSSNQSKKAPPSTLRVKAFCARNPWYLPAKYAKRRCTDPKHKEYHRYGGRGVRYTLSKEQVIEIYERDKGHLLKQPSLDRKNPDGHYEYSNVRFMERDENIALRRAAGTAPQFTTPDNQENMEWEE